jgi:hypothetical protein
VAQGEDPEFKTQYCKKKRKEENKNKKQQILSRMGENNYTLLVKT